MMQSVTIGGLVKALTNAQKQFAPILKNKENPYFHSQYADLSSVIQATKDALIENGLALVQFPIISESRVGVLSILAHSSGEFLAESFTLPLAKQDAQAGVAAITYARRAAYQSILGIAPEDDDGNIASGKTGPMITKSETDREVSQERPKRPKAAIVPTESETDPEPQPYNEAAPSVVAVAPASVAAPSRKIPAEGNLPSKEELESFRQRAKEVIRTLSDPQKGGLKASKGIDVPRKVVMYILKATGASDIQNITKSQWETVFSIFEKAAGMDGGYKKLAKAINTSALQKDNPETEETNHGE